MLDLLNKMEFKQQNTVLTNQAVVNEFLMGFTFVGTGQCA